MQVELVCIVEGQGDEVAVPILVRRIAFLLDKSLSVRCHPWRRSKGALLKAHGLERDVEMAVRRYPNAVGLLVLIDADRDCPALLGPELLRRARSILPQMRIGVVFAKCEYEAWFIAAFQSLAKHPDVLPNLEATRPPEEILGAKEWLAKQMIRGKSVETRHQPAFTQLMSLEEALETRSFRKLMSEIRHLLQ